MERSQQQRLILSQQLAALRLGRYFSATWAKTLYEPQQGVAISASPGEPMDTRVFGLGMLAWRIAMMAQCSAYLAERLQILAQSCSDQQIECPEWTYNQLYASVEIVRTLLESMSQRLEGTYEKGDVTEVLRSFVEVREEIRSSLGRE